MTYKCNQKAFLRNECAMSTSYYSESSGSKEINIFSWETKEEGDRGGWQLYFFSLNKNRSWSWKLM